MLTRQGAASNYSRWFCIATTMKPRSSCGPNALCECVLLAQRSTRQGSGHRSKNSAGREPFRARPPSESREIGSGAQKGKLSNALRFRARPTRDPFRTEREGCNLGSIRFALKTDRICLMLRLRYRSLPCVDLGLVFVQYIGDGTSCLALSAADT
jgi:hypothetical protein